MVRAARWTWILVLLAAIGLDGYLIAHQFIKMEMSNVSELEYCALSRDGIVVLSSPIGSSAEALLTWLFHLPLLFTPRLERVAILLNLIHYLAVFVLYVGMKRRFGPVAGAVSSGLLLAAPVSFILSKHLIPTTFVPLVGSLYVLRHLDFARAGDRRSLGWCVGLLGVLVALNHAHAFIALALLREMRRAKAWRVPWWGVAGAAAALSSAAFKAFWAFGSLGWGAASLSPSLSTRYHGVGQFLERLVFVEGDVAPNINLLYALCAWSLFRLWKSRPPGPAGLALLLAYCVPAAMSNGEARIFWQVPFYVLVGWGARTSGGLAVTVLAHLLLAMASYGWMYGKFLHTPNFLTASFVDVRYRMYGVLAGEMGMRAKEFETLQARYAERDGDTPALVPGLSYMVDRVFPALPPGGDRCFSVSDGDEPLPAGAVLDRKIERDGLFYRSWRGGAACAGNVRQPIAPVLGLDLRRGEVRVISFPGPGSPRR